jgi:glucan biosynthesis protein C
MTKGMTVEGKRARMLYIDNIRLLMIAFVVIQHLAVTYSGYGSWYYKEGKPLGFGSSVIFGFYQSLTQGYFMGLLFLIAGYFVPSAYDRKGFGKFISDRMFRLGIPALIYMLAIHPFVVFVLLAPRGLRDGAILLHRYAKYLLRFEFIGSSGPLWFALALLIFSVLYAVVRLVSGRLPTERPRGGIKPNTAVIVSLMLVIALPAFLIRTVQPIGTSFLNMQLCYFAQYAVLFIAGTCAYRRDVFSSLDYGAGVRWLMAALTLGFAAWGALMVTGGATRGDMTALNGGFTWQNAAFSLWESFTAVAVDFGLLVLFRDRLNAQGAFVRGLSASAFAVYVFHTPLIIAIALLFRPVGILPILKFAVMCVACLPVCFACAFYVVRRIPLLSKVI